MAPLTGLEEIVRLSSKDIIWLQREFYAKKTSQEKRYYLRKDTPVAVQSDDLLSNREQTLTAQDSGLLGHTLMYCAARERFFLDKS